MSTAVVALVLLGGLTLILVDGRRRTRGWYAAIPRVAYACVVLGMLTGCGGGSQNGAMVTPGEVAAVENGSGGMPTPNSGPIKTAPEPGGGSGPAGGGGGGSGEGTHAPEINPNAAVVALVLLGGLTMIVIDRRRQPGTSPCI
ncbi:MAG TPA: hypothetical protein VKD90_00840 [Gemmataceae bacterium]|nr:hypothetical protein [Gemmataceae bacterium]